MELIKMYIVELSSSELYGFAVFDIIFQLNWL